MVGETEVEFSHSEYTKFKKRINYTHEIKNLSHLFSKIQKRKLALG